MGPLSAWVPGWPSPEGAAGGHAIQGNKMAADLSVGDESQLILVGFFFSSSHKINWQCVP